MLLKFTVHIDHMAICINADFEAPVSGGAPGICIPDTLTGDAGAALQDPHCEGGSGGVYC